MKRLSYDDVRDIPAYDFVSNAFDFSNKSVTALANVAKMALMAGYPAQDVLTCISYELQLSKLVSPRDVQPGNIESLQLPPEVNSIFIRMGRDYVPRPVDTSHVVITPEMEAVVDKTARAIHEDWRSNRAKEGITIEENPLMRPWEELSDGEKADTLNTARETVKAIAVIGGIRGRDLDDNEMFSVLQNSLDVNTHEVWAANKIAGGTVYAVDRVKKDGKDVSHPDLLPYDQLSEGTKEYDRRIDKIILTTIRDERLEIAAQLPEKETETMGELLGVMKEAGSADAVEKADHAILEEELKYEKGPRLVHARYIIADHLLREEAETVCRDKNIMPGKDAVRTMVSRMGPFQEGTLVAGKHNGAYYVIEEGTKLSMNIDGDIIVKAKNVDGDVVSLSSKELPGIRKAVMEECRNQGFVVLDQFTVNKPEYGLHVNNLKEKVTQKKMLWSAEQLMDEFLSAGFEMVPDTGDLVRRVDPQHCSRLADTLKGKGLDIALQAFNDAGVALHYTGADENILRSMYEDREECVKEMRESEEACSVMMVGKILDNYERSKKSANPNSLEETANRFGGAVTEFMTHVKERFSEESIIWNHADRMDAAERLAESLRYKLGCSMNNRKLGLHINGLVDTITVQRNKFGQYILDMNAYQAKNAVARLFARKPEIPEMDTALAKIEELRSVLVTEATIDSILSPIDDGTIRDKAQGFYESAQKACDSLVKDIDFIRKNFAGAEETVAISKICEAVSDLKADFSAAQRQREPKNLIPEEGKMIDLLVSYGVSQTEAKAMYDTWRQGEKAVFDGELNVRPARSYDPKPSTIRVKGQIGFNEGGTLSIFSASGKEYGAFRDLVSRNRDIGRAEKEGTAKAMRQEKRQSPEQKHPKR